MVEAAFGARQGEADREAAGDPADGVSSVTATTSSSPSAPTNENTRGFSSLAPAIIGSSMLMQTLNATVLSNALPVMAHSLHENPLHLSSAISIYLLASAVFLPLSGWAADTFGAKRVLIFAIGAYAAACAAAGFAQDLTQVLVARFWEGAAGAFMMPVGRLVLLRTTPKHDLVRAMSVLTVPALLGPVIGPPIGGLIVTYGSWRWIFFLNLPIAVVGIFLVAKHIADVREERAPPLDWVGLILTGLGLASVVYGFENLGRSGVSPLTLAAALGAGAALLGVFAWWSGRTPFPILDLRLFKIQTFFVSFAGGAFVRMGVGATPFLLALLLQIGLGLTPFEAGMMTFASAAAALVMKSWAPPILRWFGFKPVLVANAIIVGVSFMGYALFDGSTPRWLIYAVLLTGGFFRSLQFTALNGIAFADVEHPQMSRASTLTTMGQQLSQSIGVGLASSLLQLFRIPAESGHMAPSAVAPAFIVIAIVTLVSTVFFLPLPSDAGAQLHGPRLIPQDDG
jgi:MFS family permease